MYMYINIVTYCMSVRVTTYVTSLCNHSIELYRTSIIQTKKIYM